MTMVVRWGEREQPGENLFSITIEAPDAEAFVMLLRSMADEVTRHRLMLSKLESMNAEDRRRLLQWVALRAAGVDEPPPAGGSSEPEGGAR